MTTVGTAGLRVAGQLGLELRAHELGALRGRGVLGQRRRHALAVGRAQRQRDGEQRAAVGRVAERDLAAVQLDELAHDRQPEAGARAGGAPVAVEPGAEAPEDACRGARAGRPGP